MKLFSCTDLTKRYPNGAFTLSDITLGLESGKITGVVGENGNGKTTLLRIIAGELSHDTGSMSYFGENEVAVLTWENIRSRVAYISQRIPKWHGLLKSNLIFEASIRGINGDEADFMVDELLEKLGLQEYADLKWKEISTGYRLRFQLAKMLIGSPELLVLDEPIANLDINAQEKFLADLRTIVTEPGRNVSVILSSQQLHEIENVSDSIVFLKKGEMIYSGEVDKIGESRTFNEFEIQTDLDISILKELIPEGGALNVVGKTVHVKVRLDLSAEAFLDIILKKGGKVMYFRNISSSTRRLFND
ncbi:MAG: ATP-binding cassette domain-containing protein [Crocinitomix sp.]|nr:ATP-binding cassette domain-containing protein [Crocinitomix sp.]